MSGHVLLTAAAAAAVIWAGRLAMLPYGPCPACKRRRGHGAGSTSTAWSRRRRCGGTGERIRPGARTIRRAIGRPVSKKEKP